MWSELSRDGIGRDLQQLPLNVYHEREVERASPRKPRASELFHARSQGQHLVEKNGHLQLTPLAHEDKIPTDCVRGNITLERKLDEIAATKNSLSAALLAWKTYLHMCEQKILSRTHSDVSDNDDEVHSVGIYDSDLHIRRNVGPVEHPRELQREKETHERVAHSKITFAPAQLEEDRVQRNMAGITQQEAIEAAKRAAAAESQGEASTMQAVASRRAEENQKQEQTKNRLENEWIFLGDRSSATDMARIFRVHGNPPRVYSDEQNRREGADETGQINAESQGDAGAKGGMDTVRGGTSNEGDEDGAGQRPHGREEKMKRAEQEVEECKQVGHVSARVFKIREEKRLKDSKESIGTEASVQYVQHGSHLLMLEFETELAKKNGECSREDRADMLNGPDAHEQNYTTPVSSVPKEQGAIAASSVTSWLEFGLSDGVSDTNDLHLSDDTSDMPLRETSNVVNAHDTQWMDVASAADPYVTDVTEDSCSEALPNRALVGNSRWVAANSNRHKDRIPLKGPLEGSSRWVQTDDTRERIAMQARVEEEEKEAAFTVFQCNNALHDSNDDASEAKLQGKSCTIFLPYKSTGNPSEKIVETSDPAGWLNGGGDRNEVGGSDTGTSCDGRISD